MIWIDSIKALAAFFIAFLSACSLGSLVYPSRIFPVLVQGIIRLALGFAVLSLGVIVLSYLHALNRFGLWLLVSAPILLGWRSLPAVAHWLGDVKKSLSPGREPFAVALSVLFFLSCLPLLAGVLAPETGGDALTYQLHVPKMFLAQGSIDPIAHDRNSFYPMFLHHLYLTGLATGGVGSAKAFHCVLGIMLFLLVKAAVEELTSSKLWGYFAGMVLWLTPAMYRLLATTYVDVGWAFYLFLSLYLWCQGCQKQRAGIIGLAGIAAGAALSIKYSALVFFAALSVAGLWCWWKSKKKPFFYKGIGAWIAGCLLISGFWLLRNGMAKGNPFFPYLAEWFGTQPIRDQHFHLHGLGHSPIHLVFSLWNLFARPEAFGGWTLGIGPFYAAYFPWMVLVAFVFIGPVRPYALFAIAAVFGWFYTAQVERYLFPALPAIAVAGTVGMSVLARRIPFKSVWKFLALALLALEAVAGMYHFRYTYLLFSGHWTKDVYLTKMERTYPAAMWINRHLPPSATILLEKEIRQFYINRSLVRDEFLKYDMGYDLKPLDVPGFHRLLASQGVTHILLSDPLGREPASGGLPRALARSEHATLIYEGVSENIRDERFIYRLYQLRPRDGDA